jgi:hypothetical protein
VLAPALLEDARATRAHLMRRCLEARRYLGLVEVTAPEPEAEAAEMPQAP